MYNREKLINEYYKPDERLLFSKVLDQVFICLNEHADTYSDFLDPAKSRMFYDTLSFNFNRELNIIAFGGANDCERQIIGFSQKYNEFSTDDFPIKSLEINYPEEYGKKLGHRDFLGSILGLGIDRDLVGDIFVFNKRAIVFLKEDIAGYVEMNLKKIGRVGVETKFIEDDYLFPPLGDFKIEEIYTSSLRLDLIISQGFNLSRRESQNLINGDKVEINWNRERNTSKTIETGDNITLRGYGRIGIEEIIINRKDNYYIKIKKFG